MSKIAPSLPYAPGYDVLTCAAGCFWGVEHIFRKHFGNGKGLVAAAVGYSGGSKSHPSYQEVCSTSTGHAESLQVIFDPKIVSYETLVDFFFRIHDPTTLNRQGNDAGTQYRSAVFVHNDAQSATAHAVRDRLQKTFYSKPIVTQIIPISEFWEAEKYHQQYLNKNPQGYQCPTHFLRTRPQ